MPETKSKNNTRRNNRRGRGQKGGKGEKPNGGTRSPSQRRPLRPHQCTSVQRMAKEWKTPCTPKMHMRSTCVNFDG